MRRRDTDLSVAIIELVGGHGGMDYYDFGLCEGLVQAGVTPTLYTCDRTDTAAARNFRVNLWFRGIFSDRPLLARAAAFLLGTVRSLADAIRRGVPVVHYHFFDVALLQALLVVLAKASRRKVVVTVHDVEAFVLRPDSSAWLARWVYSLADGLIVHNRSSMQALIGTLGIRQERIAIIPHGGYSHFYPDRQSRCQARTELGWPGDAMVLLFFGQLKRVKGLEVLLTAFAELVQRRRNVRLAIAGKEVDVPFDDYLELLDTRGLRPYCMLEIGHIPNARAPLYFRAADLVVLPYRRIYQSGVALMAMTLGTPVVVSDLPGMLDIVTHLKTGFVFRDGDAHDLAVKLEGAIDDEQARARVSENAARMVQTEHGWPRIGSLTAQFYRTLLPRPPGD